VSIDVFSNSIANTLPTSWLLVAGKYCVKNSLFNRTWYQRRFM